jgi:hypothetical protein
MKQMNSLLYKSLTGCNINSCWLKLLLLLLFPGIQILYGQNVGIGTNTPSQKFTIQTPAAVSRWGLIHTDSTIGIGTYVGSFGGFSYGSLGTSSEHSFGFFTNGPFTAPKLTIHRNKWVGLGTTDPLAPLHIANSSVFEPTTMVIGRNHTAGGYTAMYMGNTANRNGYNYIQSVDNSGVSFGMLALNPYGGMVSVGVGGTVVNHRVYGDVNVGQDMYVSGKLIRPATGSVNLLPMCMGVVNSDGTILSGTGNFTATHTGTGSYEISINGETFTSANQNNYAILITTNSSNHVASYSFFFNNNININIYNNRLHYTNRSCSSLGACPEQSSTIEFINQGDPSNSGFNFMVFKL